jgi:hypothetical protein
MSPPHSLAVNRIGQIVSRRFSNNSPSNCPATATLIVENFNSVGPRKKAGFPPDFPGCRLASGSILGGLWAMDPPSEITGNHVALSYQVGWQTRMSARRD